MKNPIELPEQGAAARKFLTPDEVAGALQIDVQTIRAMCKSGELRAIRVRKFYRIDPKDYEEFLKASRITD